VSITMDCVGCHAVASGFATARAALPVALPPALMQGGLILEREIKQTIIAKDIIDTGNLLNSVATRPCGPLTVEVGAHTDYAIYQEFGTYKMAARPYVRPSLTATIADIRNLLGETVMTVIEAALP